MNSYKNLQNQDNRRHKMLLILKGFRRGLNLSSSAIAQKMRYSGSMIRFYEDGKIQIKEEALREYAAIIAKMVGLDRMNFYEMLVKEADNIQDGTSTEILKAISHLICYESTLDYFKEDSNEENEKSIANNMVMILACFRRILMVGVDETMKIMHVFNLHRKEQGYLNAKKELAQAYARFIAEQMNYKDFAYFYEVLEKESARMENSIVQAFQNALKAFGRVVKQIY